MQRLFEKTSLSPWGGGSFLGFSPVPYKTLGQQEVVCEDTPEGGKRCSDGRYHPPGCPATPGAPGTVQAAPEIVSPLEGIPTWVWVAGTGALAVGAAALLAGPSPKMGAPAEWPSPYDKMQRELVLLASSITAERAADAFNFSQYQAALRKRQDLVFAERDAEARLREQERLWDATHRNMEQLAAAQAEVDRIAAEKNAAAEEAAMYRQRVEQNAKNILAYREKAAFLIAGLPEDLKDEARRIIDPCYPATPTAMKGTNRYEGITPEEYARRTTGLRRGIPAVPLGRYY